MICSLSLGFWFSFSFSGSLLLTVTLTQLLLNFTHHEKTILQCILQPSSSITNPSHLTPTITDTSLSSHSLLLNTVLTPQRQPSPSSSPHTPASPLHHSPCSTAPLPPTPPCSSVNSAHSSASRSSGGGGSVGGGGIGGGGGGSQPHSPTSSSSSSSYRYRSSLPHQPPPPGGIAAHRLSSVSSHDSGFVSQDANIYSKPPSPMPSDITSQVH